MKTTSLLIAALMLTGSAVACGSSNSVPSNPRFTCYESAQVEQASACTSCLTGECGSEVTSLLSACSSYLTCLQTCGCGNSCTESCTAPTEDCGNAEATLQGCEDSSCASDCGISSGGGGGGAGGGQ